MKNSVIYYPYIRVPETPWFSRVLLYWDSVGAIVPTEYLEDPDRLGPFMTSLVKEGLVHQVVPGYYLGMAPNFTEAFLDYLDQLPANRARSERQAAFRIHSESLPGEEVHLEKLQGLGDALVERGLAHRDDTGRFSNWFEVEPSVARDFMAYLAGVLGQVLGDDQFYPITDEANHLDAFLSKSTQCDVLRNVVLDAVLPAPGENVEAPRIADFKYKYSDELSHFRLAIEEEISQLSAIGEESARSRRMDDVVSRLKRDREALVARMNEERGWPRVGFADLCAIVGGSIGGHEALTSEDWRLGTAGAAAAIAPAIYNAFRGSHRELRRKPLAYASLAATEFSDAQST